MSHGPTAMESRHLRTLFAVGAAGMLTDGQLLERFARRDGDSAELAFAALVERHGSMVLRVARGVSSDEHSAHDVFQATFLILARKARSLWVRESIGPWLHGVAYRVASQTRSTDLRRKRRETAAARPELTHSQDRDRADLIRAIHEEIHRLPRPYRLAVVSCHLEGLTQQDAAERLGWPVGTLQSRLARGRQKLRGQLERRGLDPSLGVIACALPSVPHVLTATTARAAASLALGQAITGMIAPGAFAMIQTTTQGMLMTKLKLGAAAVLMMVGGIVGTKMAVGFGRPAQAIDEPKSASTVVPPRVYLPPVTGSKTDEPIPPPLHDSLDVALLYLHNSDPELNQAMKPVLESLLHNGYTVKSVDIQRFPSYRERFKIDSVPSYVLLVDGDAFRQTQGVKTASQLAEFYNDVFGLNDQIKPAVPMPSGKPSGPLKPNPNDQTSKENQKQPAESEPGFRPPKARPWETVVQVVLPDEEEPRRRFSGTLIQGPGRNKIVVTCASNFAKEKNVYRVGTGSYQGRIQVDLYDGRLQGTKPAAVHELNRPSISGSLLDIDYDLNIALIWVDASVNQLPEDLPVAWLVDEDWIPEKGMEMVTVGCSDQLRTATAWDTTILEAEYLTRRLNPSTPNPIQCAFEPKPTRFGGGLFNTGGDLVGVCLSSDPESHTGFYARPEAIRRLLVRSPIDREFKRNWTWNLEERSPSPNPNNGTLTEKVTGEPSLTHPPDSLPAGSIIRENNPAANPPAPVQNVEPSLTLPTDNPKPWETVVRVKIHLSDKEWGFGSGTVISSSPEESIILTCGHVFRVKGANPPKRPKDFNWPITVDLFNGQLVGRAPARVGRGQQDISAEVIDYDFDNDVGLIRIRPGKTLPVSRVVSPDWHPSKGMKMYTVGCSHGEDATAWDTKILDPRVTMSNAATKKTFFEIKCANQPKEGRTGGGLYTTDGYVAGVCNFADPEEHVGLYAVPDAIHKLLDRNGMNSLYQDPKPVKVADVEIHGFKDPAPADMLKAAGHVNLPVSDDQRRIDDLEKKLDQVLKAFEDLKGKAKPE